MKTNDIISALETRWFMSAMATGAIGILWTKMAGFFTQSWMNTIGLVVIGVAFLLFVSASIGYLWRVLFFWKSVHEDFSNPGTAKFFAGISISMAVLSTAVSTVLVPQGVLGNISGMWLGGILYGASFLLGLFFLIGICSHTILSEKSDLKQAIGTCLLPPVGIFVTLFAGNFFAKTFIAGTILANVIGWVHFFLFLMMVMLTGFVITFILFRLKFSPLPRREMAPSFVIPLAPVGVSIIAGITLIPLLSEVLPYELLLMQFLYLFVPAVLAFGLFWFLIALNVLVKYIRTEGLPYTLGFWALVFPPAALGIGTFTSSQFLPGMQFLAWIGVFWGILGMMLWIMVFTKTLMAIATGRAFLRPKCLQNNPEIK